jgi:hypothetical protein
MVGCLGVGDELLKGLDQHAGGLHALRGVDQEDLMVLLAVIQSSWVSDVSSWPNSSAVMSRNLI